MNRKIISLTEIHTIVHTIESLEKIKKRKEDGFEYISDREWFEDTEGIGIKVTNEKGYKHRRKVTYEIPDNPRYNKVIVLYACDDDNTIEEIREYQDSNQEGRTVRFLPYIDNNGKALIKDIVEYHNNQRHGTTYVFSTLTRTGSQQVAEIQHYEDGKKEGERKIFYPNYSQQHQQKVQRVEQYKEDLLDGEVVTFFRSTGSNGAQLVEERALYEKGMRTGNVTQYSSDCDPEGQQFKYAVIPHRNNKPHGLATFYYEKFNEELKQPIKKTINYIKGKIIGSVMEYNEDGSPAKVSITKDQAPKGRRSEEWEEGPYIKMTRKRETKKTATGWLQTITRIKKRVSWI